MLIEGQFAVPAAPELLLQHLFDVRLMASCLPGCETIEPIDDKKYRAVIAMAMAGIKARFDLEVEITRQDTHNVWATTRGEEGGRASTLQADSQITLQVGGSQIVMTPADITISSSQITIGASGPTDLQGATVNILADSNCTVSAATLTCEATGANTVRGATVAVNGSGGVTITGASVEHNG